ncbi:MAG: hypothetical protein R2825_04080 [Saprospiraceae bacterium]
MNVSPTQALLVSTLLLLLTACQRPFLADDDTATIAVWDLVDFKSEQLIIATHATPFEWHIITENQFARFDGDNKVLEIRPLPRNEGVLGVPALSDNSFVRITTNQDAQQVIEFRLSRNPEEVYTIIADDLAGPSDSFVEVETFGHRLGVFSTDGTLFMLPIKVLPDRHYAMLLFEVRHNPAHTSFTSVELVKRIDLTSLSTDISKLNSMRFVNGNFYVTSHEGAWRITPSGESKKIFIQWMLDAFTWQGDLYITGINSFDLHKSTDNGLTWERLNHESALQLVANSNQILFTQKAPGLVFQRVDDDLMKAKNIVLPADHTQLEAIYYGAFFFGGHYYFSMDREVYVTDVIVTE